MAICNFSRLAAAEQSLASLCIKHLETEYRYWYGGAVAQPCWAEQAQACARLIAPLARRILGEFHRCDSEYHDLEHTIQVVLVGAEILNGRLRCGETLTPEDWLSFMVALLCHDIGYIKGVCPNDDLSVQRFSCGPSDCLLTLSPQATGASLTRCHVKRSQQFVREVIGAEYPPKIYPWLKLDWIIYAIGQTQFPVLPELFKQNTDLAARLVRAADLLGQLADPSYLVKLPALFREFEETGSNQAFGYSAPEDLRASFPNFYWKNVSVYVMQGIRYLEMSQSGQAVLENLYNNRSRVEKELNHLYGTKRRPTYRLRQWLQRWQPSLHQRSSTNVLI